jgi:hypothetical protein
MNVFRIRPHWHALVFEYGLGVIAAWHLAEDLLHGQGKVYSGQFYPWRQLVPMNATQYAWIVAVQVLALGLFFARIHTRLAAGAVAAMLVVDNLGSYLNHRSLLAVEFFAISLLPAPAPWTVPSVSETRRYWNLDLVRHQLTLVYLAAAMHKFNHQFLSGRTLHNLFWMTHHHGMKVYPEWLRLWLDQMAVCQLLAWTTIAVEILLAIGLNCRRSAIFCIALAVGFHLAMAMLMAYIKIFAALVMVSLVVFLPFDALEGQPLLERDGKLLTTS